MRSTFQKFMKLLNLVTSETPKMRWGFALRAMFKYMACRDGWFPFLEQYYSPPVANLQKSERIFLPKFWTFWVTALNPTAGSGWELYKTELKYWRMFCQKLSFWKILWQKLCVRQGWSHEIEISKIHENSTWGDVRDAKDALRPCAARNVEEYGL